MEKLLARILCSRASTDTRTQWYPGGWGRRPPAMQDPYQSLARFLHSSAWHACCIESK